MAAAPPSGRRGVIQENKDRNPDNGACLGVNGAPRRRRGVIQENKDRNPGERTKSVG